LEIIFPVVIIATIAGVPALIAWRRGGSTLRVIGIFVIGLVPYIGWLVSGVLALRTKSEPAVRGS
jgi:hypothetical protein